MKIVRKVTWPVLLVLLAASVAFSQSLGERSLDVHVDEKTIVRFFFLPPYSYYHVPLAFRVVGKNDPRLGTAPFASPADRTPYISLPEMQALIEALTHLKLRWQVSKDVTTPKEIQPREMTDKMQITVFASDGTDQAFLNPEKICDKFAPLDAVFKQPRARWEFQLFRIGYHCQVAGFDRNAYPEHDEVSR